jgi:hypothetical protein
VEVIPLPSATAHNVAKVLLESIVTRFGLIENTDSDNGSHFTVTIIKDFTQDLDMSWEYHIPWHPPSSGRVERMNQTLKRQMTKLILQTKLPWTKGLPIAFLQIRTAPRKDTGLSPYEMLFGLPYLGRSSDLPTMETKDQFLKNYKLGVSSTLLSLRLQGFLAPIPPLEFPAHSYRPEDCVLVKT